jgi:hypothetical protein
MNAAAAAANIASAGLPVLSAGSSSPPADARSAGAGAAARLGVAPDRRPAPDRVTRRFPGSSAGLMIRAYVSLIASHAASRSFMLKHHISYEFDRFSFSLEPVRIS